MPKAKWIIAFFLIFLFLFLRFYRINNSLLFQNDMGRDLLVLQEWQERGTPPLLGPPTSALPINQSPIYYYLLYPIFLLTQKSPLTALYLNALLYVGSFLLGLYFFHQNPRFQKILFFSFFLICLHPQYIIQSRFIWNPSLVTSFIITSVFAFYFWLTNSKNTILWLFSLSVALAVSLSYSIAPLLIAYLFYYLIFSRQKILRFFLTLTFSFGIINLPLLFFYTRQFIVTKTFSIQGQAFQTGNNPVSKILDFGHYVFSLNNQPLIFLFFILLIISLILIFLHSHDNLKKYLSFLTLATVIFTLVSPFNLQAHYIFALTSLLFLFTSSLPTLLLLPIVIIFTFISLNPSSLQNYFQSAPRTYKQMNSCYQKFAKTSKSRPLSPFNPVFIHTTSVLKPAT